MAKLSNHTSTKIILIAVIVSLIGISACSGGGASPDTSADNTLTVFAAASLTGVFSELVEQFEAENPGIEVEVNFAGSQQLAQQLAEGAPADVFISANQMQMQNAIDSDRVDEDQTRVLIGNRLLVVYPADNPAGVKRLIDLARPGLKLVLAAEEVPAGAYALEFLDMASQDPAFGKEFKSNVLSNVVSYEQNVRAVFTKVQLGEADAGIIYQSDVAGADPSEVNVLTIPTPLNINASYYIAPIKDRAHTELTRTFIEMLTSMEVQDLMAEYGFVPVY